MIKMRCSLTWRKLKRKHRKWKHVMDAPRGNRSICRDIISPDQGLRSTVPRGMDSKDPGNEAAKHWFKYFNNEGVIHVVKFKIKFRYFAVYLKARSNYVMYYMQ